ncbi:AsmA family protein [Roseomonas marmotae]|uniref:AsmA family protein n=1 Tax=Roseomonas marmotae TaxID=2768161 RepID=A0ABS3K8P2_9PROT|nr:AsmA family protein [Roseomonas marmotae]MBO1073837.1 AsmA family protein [Roseomonas marmotae]QTI78534.1 AsmA family protein [Roseomonas marmotae]
MAPPRPRRGRRALIVLAVVLAVPATGYGALRFLLRDEALRPRLIAAVQEETGRKLTLSGPIGLKLSLVPTVTLEGVALSNAPGGSRPDMLTARRVEAKLALLPLFSRRLDFQQVTLIGPDLLLERDAEGQGNWIFAPPLRDAPARPAGAQAPGGMEEPLQLSIAAIDIRDGRLSWRGPGAARAEMLEVQDLSLRAKEPSAPIAFTGRLLLRGVPLQAEGEAGPLPRLLGTAATPAEWPLRASLTAAGMRVSLQGAITRPEAAAGWRVSLDADIDRSDRLNAFLRRPLPPMSGLEIQAEAADSGPGGRPQLLSLHAHLAEGDLSSEVPGLEFGPATLFVAAPDEPAQAKATVVMNDVPWQVAATLPPLPVLLSAEPWPVGLAVRGEGISASAEGVLSGRGHRQLEAELALQAADTAPLLRAFSLTTPLLHDLRLETRLRHDETRLGVSDMRLQSRDLVVDGEAALDYSAPRQRLTARLSAPRLDLDALLKVRPLPPAPTTSPDVPPPMPATPPVPAAPQAPAAAGPETRRLIPPLPLPVGWMGAADADLQLRVGDLTAGGVLYRDQRVTLRLADGQLTLDPVSLGIPGGRLSLILRADSTALPPRFHLTARQEGEGIELRPLLQSYRLPSQSSGQLELEANLTGAGHDLQAVAGSLDGSIGLAVVNGQVSNALLDRLLGDLRRLLVQGESGEGSTALRCLALRLALREGVARPQAMLLESGLGNVAGSGEIDLGEERLNLRLLPQVRLGGVGLSAPVRVTGSFAKPGYRLDQGGAAQAAAGILADLAARQKESDIAALGQLAESLIGRGSGGLPDCAQQLSVARGGRSGPMPAAEARPGPEQRRPNAGDLLRQLLGR